MNFLRGIVIFSALKSIFCADWDYLDKGPDFWFKAIDPSSPTCGSGQMQSPINIIPSTTFYNSKLTDISFNGYSASLRWKIKNTGDSIKGELVTGQAAPFITGSDYSKQYNLLQFHFHWGQNDFQGSEHTMDYKKFPLELHLVHQDSTGTLAVVGFFFQISESENTALRSLINGIDLLTTTVNSETTIDFNLGSILPSADVLKIGGYFRYLGSLTTPPCTEGVIWTVYNSLISIQSAQLKKFRDKTGLKITFRDPQRVSNRIVYSSVRYNNALKLKSNQIFIICFLYILLSFSQ